MDADLVVEGGGVKVIGLVGALLVAEKKGFTWKRVAGTSAGSIVTTLLAAGFRADELYKLLLEFDMSQLIHKSPIQRIPYIGSALKVWLSKGLHSASPLEAWIDSLLARKGVRTFADLNHEMEINIIASDITTGNLMVLPRDLPRYGYDPANFSVAKAVRMSCSIPFFFEPTKILNRETTKECYVVDGAVLSNFPVWIFDDLPERPTFGLRLFSKEKHHFHEIHGPISMFTSMFLTMMDAHDNLYIHKKDQLRTITVPSLEVKLTDFSISREKKEQLFRSGVKAAEVFFDNWTIEKYIQTRYQPVAKDKVI
ncbi:NTE family protein [Seinonella peptonophila]|uniref:NTE family protein n=1 Tax=Seinonella peptonophila TaxID=112248 RepID=A0A1M4TNR1_9BACL|nr:patatin-like phospholipase family protein [Seinonella peptonophila]SHE46149.1 NTE family protein [Seinonella peptonophila]